MDSNTILNTLLEADGRAARLVDEAQRTADDLDDRIARGREAISLKLQDETRGMIASAEADEEKRAAVQRAAIQRETEEALEALKADYRKKRAGYADIIFNIATGRSHEHK